MLADVERILVETEITACDPREWIGKDGSTFFDFEVHFLASSRVLSLASRCVVDTIQGFLIFPPYMIGSYCYGRIRFRMSRGVCATHHLRAPLPVHRPKKARPHRNYGYQ